MIIAAASGDRVASRAIRNGVVSGIALEGVITRAAAHGDGRRSCNDVIIAASADDFLEAGDLIVADFAAAGSSVFKVSRNLQGGRRIIQNILPAAAIMQQHAATLAEFPPRQAPPDFNPQAMVTAVIKAAAERQGN